MFEIFKQDMTIEQLITALEALIYDLCSGSYWKLSFYALFIILVWVVGVAFWFYGNDE